jgi:hypothetical protein
LKQNLANALGCKTQRKIVVIESDDWGAIRMPSKIIYNDLLRQGIVINGHYNRFDSLETSDDISALCDVLCSVRDKNGKHPIITTNYLTANPDFQRIRDDQFKQYHYELFTETYRRVSGCSESFRVLKEGMDMGLFKPQSHGREHLNVPLWMAALRSGDRDTLLAFDHGFWGHATNYAYAKRKHFLAAFDYNSKDQANQVMQIAVEGVKLFQQIFVYRSKTFIAPNYIWSSDLERFLAGEGVTLLQGQRNQLIPKVNSSRYRTRFHFSGQKNRIGQQYLVRNAFFEPSSNLSKDWVSSCLKEINCAFFWESPAVISVHRVNFMGSLVPENRDHNLAFFKQLLGKVVRRWPEVEFLPSDQLIDLMEHANG